MGTALALGIAALVAAQVQLPGTQPNELTLPPEPSSTCGCHESFTADSITEPGQSYKATLMALGGRDPLFRAAFVVANQDRPDLSDLCLRCHTPSAWLNGRSEGDLSDLLPEDLESVTCDVCHRMVPSTPQLIGSGQFTISPSTAKRSQRGSAPFGGHMVQRTDFQKSAELCGACHSLFNPAENAHDENGVNLGFPYYEQRTYEEWRDSVFPARNQSCIDCHMPKVRGAAVRGGDEYDDLAVHAFVGGNDFAVKAVRLLNPRLPIQVEASEVSRWVDATLRASAEIEIRATTPAQLDLRSGEAFGLDVRITNKTGHKLPSGYPEGRRVYLEVALELNGQRTVLSGRWDSVSGLVERDPQLRAYETQHGRVENGVGERTHHLILMNQVLTDTRIPPEGFDPDHADMIPVGRDFGAAAPYRHWDDHSYVFEAPEVTGTATGTLSVRAMYQATDGEVVQFLIDASAGTQESEDLRMVWEMLGHAPPSEIAVTRVPIAVTERPPVVDAGVSDSGVDRMVEEGGCACSGSGEGRFGGEGLWMAILLLGLRRRKRQ